MNKPTSKEREEAIKVVEKLKAETIMWSPSEGYGEDLQKYVKNALQTLISIAKQQEVGWEYIAEVLDLMGTNTNRTKAQALKDKFIITRRGDEKIKEEKNIYKSHSR